MKRLLSLASLLILAAGAAAAVAFTAPPDLPAVSTGAAPPSQVTGPVPTPPLAGPAGEYEVLSRLRVIAVPPTLEQVLGTRRVTLTLENEDFERALSLLGKAAYLRIEVEKSVKQRMDRGRVRVTWSGRDVLLADALHTLLDPHDLAAQPAGDGLVVVERPLTPEAEARNALLKEVAVTFIVHCSDPALTFVQVERYTKDGVAHSTRRVGEKLLGDDGLLLAISQRAARVRFRGFEFDVVPDATPADYPESAVALLPALPQAAPAPAPAMEILPPPETLDLSGFKGRTVREALAGVEAESRWNEAAGRFDGLRLLRLPPGHPAWALGFQPGDVLRSIDGKEITNLVALRLWIEDHPAQERYVVRFERPGSDAGANLARVRVLAPPPPRR
ncbi:MAG: hypothetical protein HY719_00410 [Planctomycetes bacterium]|nr:hypothetical protein [Planctomycetota bacterium]